MHYVPGCPIAKSKDLVNWELAGYVVPRFNEDPRYDLNGGDRYLRGSWAATLRHHNGLFYVGFCTPNGEGTEPGHFSICTAKSARGPWTRTIFPEYLYDPGLLFDDDGRVYVAHGQDTLYITELAPDALSVKVPQKKVFQHRAYPYLEGSHFYKIGGKYYLLGSSGGTQGRQVCLRSDQVYGPYEHKVILEDDSSYPGNGLHQGGMVQLKDGTWWFLIMQDRGPIGRVPNLQPVQWVDGWPMLGKGGKGIITGRKPAIPGRHAIRVPATSDEFNGPDLGLQWQWNHNPVPAAWSLSERPGYLRLRAGRAEGLLSARNTLTQRVQGPECTAAVEVDVRGLKDGDTAGFGIFQKPYAFVAVQQQGASRRVVMVENGRTVATLDGIRGDRFWFKARATHLGFTATFSYSLDGRSYQPIGTQLKMGLGLDWTANRFALFNFNTSTAGPGGHADFNWFHFQGQAPEAKGTSKFGTSVRQRRKENGAQ
jgi:beta-xylosidase